MLKKFRIKVNGKEYIVEMEDLNSDVQFQSSANSSSSVSTPIESTAIPQDGPTSKDELKSATSGPGSGEPMVSPMPGTILDVFVSTGDMVRENQPILVLEAMKMENKIVAPKDGQITSILIQKGQTVDVGAVLFTVE